MDGQIDGNINKPVVEPGVPAKRPKLDSSPREKKVEIYSKVMSSLQISPPSVSMLPKVRTVSSADSPCQKASHAFDFRFVSSDDEVRQLLVDQTCDEHRDVTVISHPDDLSQANLVSRLSIASDGRHALSSGKLFEGSQPLTLVLDIRKLTSEELPKFNDLLDPDNPCLYDKVRREKRPLGKHVSLLVLADPGQLESVGSDDKAPGADFWRRINRPGNTWQFDEQTDSTTDSAPSMAIDKVPPLLAELAPDESVMDDDTTVVIDCHLHSNWRQLLLGGPGVDQQGRIQHLPGKLELLRAGQQVILKGANWQDLAFEQTIRQMLAQQSFESNGKVCQLPDNVQFYQMPAGEDELHSLFQSLTDANKRRVSHKASQHPIIINQGNVREWLSPIAIAPEGYAVPNTSLLEQVKAGGVVTVTSSLTETLWFSLLGSLQTIRETTGLKPRLQVVHTRQQPKALALAENDGHLLSNPCKKARGFNTVTYQQHNQACHWIKSHPQAPLVIQVNNQTGFSQLFDNIHITSEQKAYFGRRESGLQATLTAGRPVVFRGLETNPAIQQRLEPMMVGQPLLVNGQLQAYPQARVTILWPESEKSSSTLFNSLIARGERCPEVDIWEVNAGKHGISRAELPEQAVNQLYKAFGTVPGSLCHPLPKMTEALLNQLILAARRAQQVDQSQRLLPCHWRKAINSVITHGTRQNPSVRDFMKVACWLLLPDADKTPDADKKLDQAAWVDPDQLTTIVNGAPRLDRAFVKQNLWRLARAFDPEILNEALRLSCKKPLDVGEALRLSYKRPIPELCEKVFLESLCALIVAHGPEKQQQAMAKQLEIDLNAAEPYQSLAIRPTRQIKRLQDALACGWQLTLPPGQTRYDAIQALAADCFHITKTATSKTEGIERIKHRLSGTLELQDSDDKPWSALAENLYHGEINQQDRENRRLSRLYDRLEDSPVIFLQGETGTGKSYFSDKMAKASGPTTVLSLGPSDSEQTLMKRWQWREQADGDRFMKQQDRMLMEWANTSHDKEGEYITLVLDEANLTQTGLLASLNGLWEPKPCIYVNGHPVPVSKKHRVILTGNPDNYAGRQLNPTLKEKLPRTYYPRLDQAFLRDRVVEPALVKQLQQRHLKDSQINDIARSATKSVMTLWQFYQELLPEHEFTPRDLTDICSWVGWYLDRSLSAGDTVTCKQMYGLIQQSFRDVLGPEISETHQDALSALDIWFAVRYEVDNTLRDKVHNHTLPGIQQAFRAVADNIRPDFDTSGSAVCELVQQIGQDLSRTQQACHHRKKHGGRQATLIEGPAGRGKDVTLNLMIESIRKQAWDRQESMPEVYYLNACDCSWDEVCKTIQKAKDKGGIVVISEMNLIDSQHLEGELNDILAGDAHPGFHLFASINPPQYSGRKPLSPALKGRFRHLPIRQYNPAELQAIAEKVLPESPERKTAAKQLTRLHCQLRDKLQKLNLPLQLTSGDLQDVARAVVRGGDFSQESLHQCFNQHYRLYLMAAKTSLEELPGTSAPATDRGAFEPELCRWLNQTVPGMDRPWLIRRSNLDSIDEKNHEIGIRVRPNKEETKTEIIKRVAWAQWQASGLSLQPGKSDGLFTQTVYRHQQQRWFAQRFGKTGVDADSVFPLTEAHQHQRCLGKADQLILSQALAVGGDNAAKPYNPVVYEKETKALDQSTDSDHQAIPHHNDYKVFCNENFSSSMYRCRAADIYVTVNGDVKAIDLNDKAILGSEILRPDPLPGHNPLVRGQTLGVLDIPPGKGKYALPSLRPDDYIVALRVDCSYTLPCSYTLTRDMYTGLHTLSIPESEANQCIRVVYVVEPREPESRPERLTQLDTYCSEGMKAVLKGVFDHIEEQPAKIRFRLRQIKVYRGIQRIQAITRYCSEFSGEAAPQDGENFFKFLVTQRQGLCRHRVPVFVAICRYFEIPCRQINSYKHAFAEYSPDGGQTWKSVDLGPFYIRVTKITSNLELTGKGGGSNSDHSEIKGLLKGFLKAADSAQQQALAKASGMSLEQLNRVLETNRALPEADLSLHEIVEKLWQQKDLPGFSMAISILNELAGKIVCPKKGKLTIVVRPIAELARKPMSKAAAALLAQGHADQVIKQLKLLHAKMTAEGGTNRFEWASSIVKTLEISDLADPSVIEFAYEALKLGWLDPLSNYCFYEMSAVEHYKLLVRLAGVEKIRVMATHCLKRWYRALLSRGTNSKLWQLAYNHHQPSHSDAFFITHCHDGVSSTLNNAMASPSVQVGWTHQPEGVPNIERMLVHQPAFMKSDSGSAGHRPVIIIGHPSWESMLFDEKFETQFQRKIESDPESTYESFLGPTRDQFKQAIQQAFSHYLYEVTHSKGGRLTYCWAQASVKGSTYDCYEYEIADIRDTDCYGAHDPSSPEELYTMMGKIKSSFCFQEPVLDVRLLQQVHNASNALVLTSDELTKIAQEFLSTVNLDSLCDLLETKLLFRHR